MENETGTSWTDRREWEERLARGESLTAGQTQSLIEDADVGERATAILAALEEALKKELGYVVIDATTDDDGEETRLELVWVGRESD